MRRAIGVGGIERQPLAAAAERGLERVHASCRPRRWPSDRRARARAAGSSRRGPARARRGGGGVPTLAAVPPPHGITGTRGLGGQPDDRGRPRRPMPGNTAASGVRPSTHVRASSSTPVSTCAAPTMARSLSSSASGNAGVNRPRSEALGEALFFDRVRPVRDGPDLAAGLLGREDLARIAEPGRVERALERAA